MIKNIEDRNEFLERLKEKGKVLIDFYALWCGPCRALTPILEEIASEHEDIDILEVNVDHHPELAAQYDIRTIPALLLFEDGQFRDMSLGFRSKEAVIRFAKL